VTVVLSDQVVRFIRHLAPEPRRQLRRALRDLAAGKGDIRDLEPPLDGYRRLRAGAYRIIFAPSERQRIECIFAERRSVIYEVFARELASRFTAPPGD
jgi:mRNA-degrading endonuclease RelE of RelBE toxin-antitoxin system